MIRIGLVGCGRIAERGYVPAFRRAAGVRLAAVADPVPERCRRLAPGVPAFPSAAALLDAELVDALVIATPSAAHLPDARRAAALSLPVLVEKPPAPSIADAHELAALDPPPFTAFNRRFEPGIATLRSRALKAPELRLALELRTRPTSWRAYEVDDDPLTNLGPHPIDLVRWLTGSEIDRVRAAMDGHAASIELELESGATATISLHGDRPYRERVLVESLGRPLGSYRAGGLGAAVRSLVTRDQHPLAASLARQLKAFAAVAGGRSAEGLASAADGVAVMAAIEAARLSDRAGGTWRGVSQADLPG